MFVRDAEPDAHYLPTIGKHSLEKIEIHNRYVEAFATATKLGWHQRVYIGLYAGAGHARVKGSERRVETSSLGALRVSAPFTRYVFVDADPRCVEALGVRTDPFRSDSVDVRIVPGEVDQVVNKVRAQLPPFGAGKRLLSFCFLDPFRMDLRLSTIAHLLRGRLRVDLLVLLMTSDLRRNVERYRGNPNSRVSRLFDDPGWGEKQVSSGKGPASYVLQRFESAIQEMGYLGGERDGASKTVFAWRNVQQYVLQFYSRNELGLKLFRGVLAAADDQGSFL